jgi:hypothetical protein
MFFSDETATSTDAPLFPWLEPEGWKAAKQAKPSMTTPRYGYESLAPGSK